MLKQIGQLSKLQNYMTKSQSEFKTKLAMSSGGVINDSRQNWRAANHQFNMDDTANSWVLDINTRVTQVSKNDWCRSILFVDQKLLSSSGRKCSQSIFCIHAALVIWIPTTLWTLHFISSDRKNTQRKTTQKLWEKRFSEDLEYKSFCNLQVSCQLVGWMTFYRVIPILTAPLLVLFLAKVVIAVSRNSTFQQ